jgi:hypothetical protein
MKRYKYPLSHYHDTTLTMGKLIPINCIETLPGDLFQMSTGVLIRLTPLLAPLYHDVVVRIHHFFSSIRHLWDEYEDFFTGGEDGTATPEHPYISMGTVSAKGLHDYLGIPPATYSSKAMSALPFRAYADIYNNYYRDQDLIDELTISKESGADSTTSTDIQKVAWAKGYFSSIRPSSQKGDDVSIPLLDTAPVTGIGVGSAVGSSTTISLRETDASASRNTDGWQTSVDNFKMEEDSTNTGYPDIRADLSAASGIAIEDLAMAMGIQKFQERMARSGSRYSEYLRALGVRPSDGRLNEPEYLGGGKQTISFSEVLSHDSGGSDPVGTMTGHGMALLRTNKFRYFAEEHGFIMTMMSVVPHAVYSSHLHKMWTREVKEDYFQRELQFIGDQEVLNEEVHSTHATPDGIFGYMPRYDEYRSLPSRISGEFRDYYDHWNLARIFGSDPALNQSFIECTPAESRVFASTSHDTMLARISNSIQARRNVHPDPQTRLF